MLVALPALYLVLNGVRFVANGNVVGVALLLLGLVLVPLAYAKFKGTQKSAE